MTWLACVLVGIYTWFSSALLMSAAVTRGVPDLSLADKQAILLFSILATLVAHEAGHWIAGRAVGWRGLRFRIGPWGLVLTARGWRLRFIKWDFGAGVTFCPVSLDDFRRKDAIFTAGGPLASLLFASVCTSMAWHATGGVFFWVAGALAQWSWIGALSLLPAGSGLARSDGFWLWQALRGGDETERRLRYMLANISHGTEIRPRDWPEDLMGAVIQFPIPVPDRHEAYLGYVHLIDVGDPTAAFPLLSETLNTWRKSDPPEYALEAAWYAGIHARDSVASARWLACAGKDTDRWVRLRAEGALAVAEGRLDDAVRLAEEALAELEDFPGSGHRDYEAARIQEVLRAATLVSVPA